MIYLNDKLRGVPSHKFPSVSALNLILMTNGIGTVSEQSECTDVAKQSLLTLGRELGEKAVSRFKGMTAATLATFALSTAACAQEAPVQRAEFVKGKVPAAAKATPVVAKPSLAETMAASRAKLARMKAERAAAEGRVTDAQGRVEAAEGRVEAEKAKADAWKVIADEVSTFGEVKK